MEKINSFLIDTVGVTDPWIRETEGWSGIPRRIYIELSNACRLIPLLLVGWFVVMALLHGSLSTLTDGYIQLIQVPFGLVFLAGILHAVAIYMLLMPVVFPHPSERPLLLRRKQNQNQNQNQRVG